LLETEATAGIEPAMKVLQTSRSFFEAMHQFLSKFAKVRSRLTNSCAADFCLESPSRRTSVFGESRDLSVSLPDPTASHVRTRRIDSQGAADLDQFREQHVRDQRTGPRQHEWHPGAVLQLPPCRRMRCDAGARVCRENELREYPTKTPIRGLPEAGGRWDQVGASVFGRCIRGRLGRRSARRGSRWQGFESAQSMELTVGITARVVPESPSGAEDPLVSSRSALAGKRSRWAARISRLETEPAAY